MAISVQSITIDLNAREKFQKEIARGYAGIFYVNSLVKTVKCIPTHNIEFRNGDRGARDASRAKVHFEASQLPLGQQRVLSWYLELGRRGKHGSVVPHEIAAESVRRTTGGPCAERTFERHLAALCASGWLQKPRVATGTRVKKDSGAWTSRSVCKVSLTAPARLLIQKNYIPLPPPKGRETVGVKRETGDSLKSPCLSLIDDRNKSKQREPVVTGLSVELPKGNGLTRPSPASQAQTVEQRSLTSAPRKAAKIAAAVRPPVSARKTRTGIPRTWRVARKTLLAELFAFLHEDPFRDEMHRVAELQTDPHYPAALMTALDWDEIVRRWMDLDWHARRRAMKNEICPPLAAFTVHLAPGKAPGAVPETEFLKQHEELATWLRVIPDKIPASVPPMVAERMEKQRFRLNMLVRQIHAGRVPLSMLSGDDHTLLHQADLIRG